MYISWTTGQNWLKFGDKLQPDTIHDHNDTPKNVSMQASAVRNNGL